MIRSCTEEEALEILHDHHVLNQIGVYAERVLYPPKVSEIDGCRMLFFHWKSVDGKESEVHVAMPYGERKRSRQCAEEITKHLLKENRVLCTKCPQGKISNMLEKLGWKHSGNDGNMRIYEVGSWQ